MPDAFADIAHYSVQRPIGVYVFHELLPDIAEYCRMNADWSQKSFTSSCPGSRNGSSPRPGTASTAPTS